MKDSAQHGKALAVTYRAIAELKPAARNARTHSPQQIAQLAASIREFGWTNPILIDEHSQIIAGHGRVEAARSLGMADVATIALTGLSAAQKRALVLADNKLALNAGWDDALLRIELAELKAEAFDISTIGFNVAEIAGILDGIDDPAGEWGGMPEFDQQDKTAFRTIAIHFKDQASVDAFAAAIGQKITDKTRFAWYPEIEIERYADKKYAA